MRAFNVTGPVEFTPDGLGLVTLGKQGNVLVRDLVTGLEMVPDPLPPRPRFCHCDASRVRTDTFSSLISPLALFPNQRMQVNSGSDGGIGLNEVATWQTRRVIASHRPPCVALAVTPDGSRLLTAEADHTVLVWDVRLQSMPLPTEVRRETNAAKLWATMCTGKADAGYFAMARLAAEPDAAIATARKRMKPADSSETTEATQLADSRAVELLESLGTSEARDFLRELARGDASAWRTQEAKRAVDRMGR